MKSPFSVVGLILLMFLCLLAAATTGCSGKKEEAQTRNTDPATPAPKTGTAVSTSVDPSVTDISDNMNFRSAKIVSPANETIEDLDRLVAPVLKQYFGDVRLVGQTIEPSTRPDGEVILETLQYSAKRWFGPEDAKPLHTAFRDALFRPSPRLGSEPTKSNKYLMMSFFSKSSLKSYSLVVHMTVPDQTILIQSFRLGSKYDQFSKSYGAVT
ncbi:MAG: hypothetical protein M0C28_47080 [Candidatus Moduliflexus flocculans]|nr:hypothetical protein [Candidatus Moduliflexus flocculans]